jgi:hypothetical protein
MRHTVAECKWRSDVETLVFSSEMGEIVRGNGGRVRKMATSPAGSHCRIFNASGGG